MPFSGRSHCLSCSIKLWLDMNILMLKEGMIKKSKRATIMAHNWSWKAWIIGNCLENSETFWFYIFDFCQHHKTFKQALPNKLICKNCLFFIKIFLGISTSKDLLSCLFLRLLYKLLWKEANINRSNSRWWNWR